MERDDSRSDQLAVPGNMPHGVRDTDRDVGACLRASMGGLGKDVRVGPLDCGCCCCSTDYGIAVLHTVGPNLPQGGNLVTNGSRMSQNYITSLDRITALQLLPMAATIVAAGAGARIAEILPNPSDALGTILVSYILWGVATPFAMLLLVIYYQRLAVHKLPPRETIVSCFLPLGPLGFGGFG